MSRVLRLLTAPVFAATLVITALAGTARSDTDPLLAAQWQLAWTGYKFYEHLTGPLPVNGRTAQTRDISIDRSEIGRVGTTRISALSSTRSWPAE